MLRFIFVVSMLGLVIGCGGGDTRPKPTEQQKKEMQEMQATHAQAHPGGGGAPPAGTPASHTP